MSPRPLHPSVLKTSQRLSLPQCLHRPRGPSSCSAPRALESESRLAVGTPGTRHVINRPYCGKVPAAAFEPQGGVLVPQLFASLVQGSSGQHSPPPPTEVCLSGTSVRGHSIPHALLPSPRGSLFPSSPSTASSPSPWAETMVLPVTQGRVYNGSRPQCAQLENGSLNSL